MHVGHVRKFSLKSSALMFMVSISVDTMELTSRLFSNLTGKIKKCLIKIVFHGNICHDNNPFGFYSPPKSTVASRYNKKKLLARIILQCIYKQFDLVECMYSKF
jgi:hypothetical protein